jgi:DNA-binding FadR family transcriptional regulator
LAEDAALPTLPRRSLVTATIDALRTKLDVGEWQIGERLPPEADLAGALGVSRNTVREAVRVLSHAQMLDVRQGDGTYVRSVIDAAETLNRINRSSVRDHLEIQSILEAEAARFAARRRTDVDLKKLKTLLLERGHVDPADLETFLKKDHAFHMAVAAAAHNTAIEELYRYFALGIPTQSRVIREDDELHQPDLAIHQAIVDAIARKDEEGAAEAARQVLAPRITKLSHTIQKPR